MVETLGKVLETYEEHTVKDHFFTLSKGKMSYGVEIVYVAKIIGLYEMTQITGLHNNVKGLINFRDRIIPVIDTQIILNTESKPYSDTACILIFEVKKIPIGIIIDHPNEVLSMDIVINVLEMVDLTKIGSTKDFFDNLVSINL